jgi:hypothetical protein
MTNINTQKIALFAIMALGLLFALFAGNYVADEDYKPILAIIGLFSVGWLLFGIGRGAYLLIPVCWGLTGRINALPLPFDVRELTIILGSVFFTTDIIFKRSQKKRSFEIIDLLVWINILYLATVFFRNPVGINALGGDRVGGKPYLDVILGLMSYLILRKVTISQSFSTKLPRYVLIAALFTGFAGALATYVPSVAGKLSPLYSGFGSLAAAFGDYTNKDVSADDRFGFLSQPGAIIILYICSQMNPLQVFRPDHLSKMLMYLIGFVFVLLSGFRNGLVNACLTSFISVLLREKFVGFMKITCIGIIPILGLIAISYSSIQLPYGVQRTLTFLPGNWDLEAKADAKHSSEWRFEMWEIAMTSDKYIRNKLLGDGFGFTRKDYEIMMDSFVGGAGFGGENAQQERFMINGDFHSGPVSAIRFVGYVGLGLFLILLFYAAKYAFETIWLARGTPFEMCVYFYALPMMISPFFYIFVFGDYRADLIGCLFIVGMMKALRSSVSSYKQILITQ